MAEARTIASIRRWRLTAASKRGLAECYPPSEAGSRVGLVLSPTLAGMAIGGWMSGAIFDATLSYRAAFLNGFAWSLLNMAIAAWLLLRLPRRRMARFA